MVRSCIAGAKAGIGLSDICEKLRLRTLFVFPDIGVVEILAWFTAAACVLWVDRFRAEKSFNGC